VPGKVVSGGRFALHSPPALRKECNCIVVVPLHHLNPSLKGAVSGKWGVHENSNLESFKTKKIVPSFGRQENAGAYYGEGK